MADAQAYLEADQAAKGTKSVKRTYRRTLLAVLEALLFASILALMLRDITYGLLFFVVFFAGKYPSSATSFWPSGLRVQSINFFTAPSGRFTVYM